MMGTYTLVVKTNTEGDTPLKATLLDEKGRRVDYYFFYTYWGARRWARRTLRRRKRVVERRYEMKA